MMIRISNNVVVEITRVLVPVIERIDPERATRSTEVQPLTLSGQFFARGVSITLTDPTGAVRIIDSGAIEAVTPTSVRFRTVLDISGEYTVTVQVT